MTTTAIARIEATPAAELFKPGALDPVLDAIKAEVRREAACLDISTDANRKAIASLAFKVAKSKTFLDTQGKKLVAAEKDRLKVIDRERGRVWDELELLQAEVRKPLTDWENAEKERVANHEAALKELVDAGHISELNWNNPNAPVSLMHSRLEAIMKSTYDWQEFHQRAVATVTATIRQIKEAIAKREKYEAEQEELVQLRASQAKRDQEERDAAIAKEASDRAEAAAHLREQEQRQAAEAERQRIEHERLQAEARAKQAEAQRIEAEERAQREAVEAAERLKAQEARAVVQALQAKREAEERTKAAAAKAEAGRIAAVEDERARAAEEKRKSAEDTAKREANRKHSAKINAEIRDALIIKVPSLDRADAILIINAISAGLIPHTKINY